MHSSLGFLLLLPLASLVVAQTITACPANAKTFTLDDGSIYEHCPYADYQGSLTTSIPNIYTAANCVQACKNNTACTQATWDTYAYSCNIKASSGTTWVKGTKTDTIRFVSKGTQPVPGLTACPSAPSYYEAQSGAVYEICPNSDYAGDTASIDWTIPDQQSCATKCSTNPSCVLGIWDKVYKACHVKSNTTTWVSRSTQFDAIRLIARPASLPAPSGLSACPNTATQWTLDDGSIYEVCPDTDFQGYSYSVIPNVLSDWDCLRLCNGDTSCTLSVFDHQQFYCHLKATSVNWVTSTKFNVARLLQRGSRSGTSASNGAGRWSAPLVLPANPVGVFVIPGTTRLLGFSSWGDDNFWGATGYTQFSDFNWATGQVSQRTVANTQHDMFCPGMSALGDGRIIVSGGEDAGKTSIYDPASDSFISGGNLNIPRGYQTSTVTDSGKVFTIGGSFSGGRNGKTGELYDPASNSWTVLSQTNVTAAYTTYDGEGDWRYDNHMWLWAWKQGSVFQAGPSKTQHWYGTSGNGSTALSGTRDPDNDAMCGLNVMYDAVNGKIWSAGGSQSYTNSPGLTTAHITTLGQPFSPASVQSVAALPRARAFANAVVLPDGTILVTGGQTNAAVFRDTLSQFVADLYSPSTNSWKTLSAAKIPRNYHSVALLLADGTVMTGGGGLCWTGQGNSDAGCDRLSEHPSVEIFSPPYLFTANGTYAIRPQLVSVATSSNSTGGSAKPSDTLTAKLGDSASGYSFSLLRAGSATHTINSDQRRVPLSATRRGAVWSMKLPSDYGIMPPGYYYLFVVSASGVPSMAKTIRVR